MRSRGGLCAFRPSRVYPSGGRGAGGRIGAINTRGVVMKKFVLGAIALALGLVALLPGVSSARLVGNHNRTRLHA